MTVLRNPRPVSSETFKVQGANNGDYGILTVPKGRKGVTVSVDGTAGSATVTIAKQTPSGITNYQNSVVAVGAQLSFEAGHNMDVYATIAAATSSTNLSITANTI